MNNVIYQRIVILESLYKTNYSTTDTGFISSIGDTIPIKYYKTSFTDRDAMLTKFISGAGIKPAGVLNILGGFSAAVLI
jgi:hypothetical protein